MAIVRFDNGVDFRNFSGIWQDIPAILDEVNITFRAKGIPDAVLPEVLRIISSEGVIGIYPQFGGSDIEVTADRITAGTLTSYYFFDGTDNNDYITGFSIAATQVNKYFNGHTPSLLNAMLAGDDQITLRGDIGHIVFAGRGNDRISGSSGNDSLNGNQGMDTINGHGADDTLIGGRGNDLLKGEMGADILQGSSGADTLWGGRGADQLFGEKGANVMNGGRGNDWIYSTGTEDQMRGGGGADRFIFNDAHSGGHQTILDFTDGVDKIQIDAASGTRVNIAVTYAGGNATVTFLDVTLTMEHIAAGSLSVAGDFLLTPLA